MFIPGIILVIGLAVLVKSSEMTIRYSVQLSKLMGISRMVIGFLLISVITSLPELSIAVISGIEGEGLLSVGNLIGSNIVNICLIFGVMALLATIRTHKEDYKELVRTLAITSMVAIIVVFLGEINFLFGIFAIATFALFFYSIYLNHYRLATKKLVYKGLRTIETIKVLFYLILSVILVIVSAKFVTDSSVTISQTLGIAESLIGATIIAVGTSLPELAISVTAIRKRNFSLAVGDIIGSVVTNLTLIFGITALFGPVIINDPVKFLAIFLLCVNMIFLFLASTMRFSKVQGAVLIAIFVIFVLAVMNYQIFFI